MAIKKLYVGGLPYSLTGDRLREVFAAHGEVKTAELVSDKFTGESRGFGFVEMGSATAADTALDALNNTDLDGRRITVAVAHDRDSSSGRGGDR